MSGIKLGGSPGTTPQEGDNAFAEEMSPRYNVPSPPPSIFAQGQLYNLPECERHVLFPQSPQLGSLDHLNKLGYLQIVGL